MDNGDMDHIFDSIMGAPEKPPVLPEMRVFVVRRMNPSPVSNADPLIQEIYVTAHFAEYGQGGVLILMAYVIDAAMNKAVSRTVRAFNSWLDVELVPMPAKSTFAH